jgi:ketosteroid isomerase-like protein
MTPTEIVTDMLHAFDTGDYERFRALLAPDCRWVNPVVRAEGADEIVDKLAGFMRGFPERRHEVSLLLESGDHVAIEGEWVATDGDGRPVRAPFAAVAHVLEDRLCALRVYLDTAPLMAQLAPVEAAA